MKTEAATRNIDPKSFDKNKTLEEQVLFLLQYAVLAPSTHNSQPWLFSVTNNICTVYYNEALVLPHADSKKRDLFISIGCAVENMLIAGQSLGLTGTVSYDEELSSRKCVTITFSTTTPEETLDPLRDVLLRRVNARGPFKNEPVHSSLEKKILEIAADSKELIDINIVADKQKINDLAYLTGEAIRKIYTRKNFRKEMSSWMNSNLSKKLTGLPGYSLKMPLVISIIIPILIRFFNIGNFLAKLNIRSVSSAPMAIIFSSTETKALWIKIGQLAERLMLSVQLEGYQTSVYVAPIEVGGFENRLQKIVGTRNLVQFMFFVGKIEGIHKTTPRISYKEKLSNHE